MTGDHCRFNMPPNLSTSHPSHLDVKPETTSGYRSIEFNRDAVVLVDVLPFDRAKRRAGLARAWRVYKEFSSGGQRAGRIVV